MVINIPYPVISLPLPKLLDFTKLSDSDEIIIHIENTLHKFASDAYYSGIEVRKQPIFGSKVYINSKLFTESSFGLPFIRFGKGSTPKITYKNKTLFTFNIHYHGLNTVGPIDGTSMEVVFGKSTLLGPDVTFHFPKITNNQSLLWFHSHNMYISMELICSGALGLIEIVDDNTKWLRKKFKYGNNHLMLIASDLDLTDKGIKTNVNLPIDQNRSGFTVINGINVINWYSDNKVPFVNFLYHYSSDNLVKIDMLNGALNWRVYHIGVCDEDSNIKNFHLIQSDSGLINPIKLKMSFLPVGGRSSILIDLNNFKNKNAYIFFYDYDLTEIFNSTVDNSIIKGTIPNFEYKSQTIYPTPIPNSEQTNLNYPIISQNNPIEQILLNGTILKPKTKNIKPFLKIIYKPDSNCDSNCESNYDYKKYFNELIFGKYDNKITLDYCVERIKKTIFGDNYYKYNKIITKPYFEYNQIINYIGLLNKKYFYNIPQININIPKRNFLLFPETNINASSSGNPNGVSEYIESSNRIMCDLWNSNELDLNYALEQYNKNPNNFKPTVLPTSKFKIYKTNDDYSNTAMISNDTIQIDFFIDPIAYGDIITKPFISIPVIFEPTNFMNIQEWINFANKTFQNIKSNEFNINEFQNYQNLGDILILDWSFFPYQYPFTNEKIIYIKTAIIKISNNSPYYIRIKGRWPILQFFGKSLSGKVLTKPNQINKLNSNTKNQYHIEPIINNS